MEKPMKKYCKALVNLAIAVIALFLIAYLLPKVLVFFLPFVIGWIIAWIASPLVRFFEEKLKLIVVVIGLVVLCIYLIGAKIVDESIGFINALPDMWQSAVADFEEIGERLNVIYARFPKDMQDTLAAIGEEASTFMGDFLGRISSPTIAAVGNFAKRLPAWLISIIMCLLSSYFFVAERNHINEWCHDHVPRLVMERLSISQSSAGP